MRQACARTCGARLRGGRGSRWCWWQSWHAYSTPPLRADPSVTACVRDVATAPDCVVAMGPVEAVMAAIGARGRPSRPWPLPQVRLRENDGYGSNLRSALLPEERRVGEEGGRQGRTRGAP